MKVPYTRYLGFNGWRNLIFELLENGLYVSLRLLGKVRPLTVEKGHPLCRGRLNFSERLWETNWSLCPSQQLSRMRCLFKTTLAQALIVNPLPARFATFSGGNAWRAGSPRVARVGGWSFYQGHPSSIWTGRRHCFHILPLPFVPSFHALRLEFQ